MTEQQQSELEQIRAGQEALREQWAGLENRLRAVEATLRTQATPVSPVTPVSPPPEPAPAAAPEEEPPTPQQQPAVPRESIEMRIGTTWLVRAGIVLLLTSLAFAGNYLYQNVVPHLGPAGKVALLYLGAGALTGLGAWLERSRQAWELSGLQNYARVVLAGGLAAIYYVTYAAHYYPNLRVIQSPLAAGALLLGWAVFLVWLADRRESEILATFAILLAYYTSAINEIASFTLCSNLVLTAGAVYLIRRHLWRIFPFASLLATFGSYGFWHYYYAHPVWRGFDAMAGMHAGDSGGFWLEGGFLFVYWALFTWAIFTAGERVLSGPRRATFISLNNGAFFLLATWLLLGDYPGAFWKWSLICGCVLVGLGEIGRRLRPALGRPAEEAYLLEGSLLITLGLVDYFSGWQLGIILAVQSRLLLAGDAPRRSGPFLAFAWATALLAFIFAAHGLAIEARASWIGALAVGGLFMEESWFCERPRPEATAADAGWVALLPLASAGFALLGTGIWFWLLETKITFAPALTPVLAGAALALLSLARALRLAAAAFFAQAYLLAAQVHWLLDYAGVPGWGNATPPWWNLAALLAATLAFGQIWKIARPAPENSRTSPGWQVTLMTLMTLGTLCGWCYFGRHLTLLHGSPFNVAARWSLYAAAVFVAGLALRERAYRLLGLLILAATLGRVVFFDLWQIDLLERALSFLTLGAVLLGIGYFYTRFGSRVRDVL